MSTLVLTNVGSRDVLYKGQEIRPPRGEGQRLLAEYETCAADLAFPIVEPLLRYLLDRHPQDTLDLYLFGTDQPDPRFQPTDTLYFARLMARRLPEVLGRRVQAQAVSVQGINPSYYDLAIEAYGRLLAEIVAADVAVCYVALAGGVPACNTALLLQGVRRYGERLQVIYSPQGGEPVPIRAGEQIGHAFREAAAVESLRRWDFANALPLLRSLDVGAGLAHLAAYAARRLDFDFEAARRALENALQQGDHPTRTFIQDRLRHDLDILLQAGESQGRLLALLRELSWNAAMCWQQRRYADFLARVYRFQEAVLRYLVEKCFGLPTDLSPAARERTQRRWEEGIRAIPGLVAYMESLALNGEKLDWRHNNRTTHKALLAFALRPEAAILPASRRGFYAALVERVNALDRLVELRHRTVVGHDFQGVSEEALRQASPQGRDGAPLSPEQALAEIVRMIEADERSGRRANPYREIADFLLARLQKGGRG